MPPNFFRSVCGDRSAECFGDELRAEADSKHGHSLLDGLANEFYFDCQMGMPLKIIDIHWTA